MIDDPVSRPRPWYRRRRGVVVLGLAVVLVAGGVAFLAAWSGRGAEEASVDDALRRFRDDGTRGTAGALRPAAGVYTYDGDGTEQLSVLDTSQRWGATLPATVTHSGECWLLRIDFSTNHWQDWRYCPDDGALRDAGGQTSQRFDFVAFTVDDLNVFTCDPPTDAIRVAARPGDTWEASCAGRSDARGTHVVSSGTNTFVGVEEVEIAGRSVRAYHYRSERTLSGDQSGTEVSETWYAVDDGLPVRSTREVRVESPSPIGTVTYTERGSFTLRSLTPRR